jgi:hypothetical protein
MRWADKKLKELGFSGLLCLVQGCACEVSDLYPCGNEDTSCVPGYRHKAYNGRCNYCGFECGGHEEGYSFFVCNIPDRRQGRGRSTK